MTLRFVASAITKCSRYGIGLLLASCTATAKVEPRAIQIQQAWQLQPGDTIGGHRVIAGLGDVSIELNGDWVYAPFDGRVQPAQAEDECVMFSSPQIPAYLVRLCGLSRPQLGEVRQGEAIGSAQNLGFATLRRLPDGKWAMVEPSNQLIEQTLRKP
ncbi:hypothetical protein H6F67_04360 [Microcoleus sp. FACHB-1515]|uniref:hypothetical protein n=1 Tax=Cyanophyceae TaxID=3028117 RepID=UPI001685C849|nr:hypothetical protein [Microcoleus sp. FACHB-1515]MBD2089086.1 hypothetical protein [Microcoleus sp. FACHB-1515]